MARVKFFVLLHYRYKESTMIEAMFEEARIVRLRDQQAVAATVLAMLALAGCFVACGRGTALADDSKRSQSTAVSTQPLTDSLTQTSRGSRCETSGKHVISINCDYIAAETVSKKSEPVIVLNHASISFEANHESLLHVELTFTQRGTSRFAADRPGYLAINGEPGENYVRRVLPHLDFRKLTPGVAATFSDEFLAPALRPGRYLVQLWIPDPNPSMKFDAAHCFLLDNVGVPDRTTGLNTIATIQILR
jgi:hypothetical protein